MTRMIRTNGRVHCTVIISGSDSRQRGSECKFKSINHLPGVSAGHRACVQTRRSIGRSDSAGTAVSANTRDCHHVVAASASRAPAAGPPTRAAQARLQDALSQYRSGYEIQTLHDCSGIHKCIRTVS